MWGHFESLWGRVNTRARARSLSPIWPAVWLLTTLDLHMSVCGQVWKTKPPTVAQHQHIV